MKTKNNKSSSQQSQTVQSGKLIIALLGESPLIEEVAQLCVSCGYTVEINNNHIHNISLPNVRSVQSFSKDSVVGIEVTNTSKEKKKERLVTMSEHLSATTPIISTSVTVTATEQASWIEGKHRLVGMGVLPSLFSKPLIEIAPTIYSPKETLTAVNNFFYTLKKNIEIVEDRVGLVLPRLLCNFINHSFFVLDETLTAPDDLDYALTHSVGLPFGPIALAEQLTFPQVYATLCAMQCELLSFHYPIAPLIHQFASAGVWLKKQKEI